MKVDLWAEVTEHMKEYAAYSDREVGHSEQDTLLLLVIAMLAGEEQRDDAMAFIDAWRQGVRWYA